ncbi:MAG: nucleotidyl transferase AbiEii/AbiGii toxin family protein, partial [Nitrospira sp.]|nr:nucleotidyl transferase AbiEii/AbiGii toxin family protein [Nitrospira sp.]
MVKIQLSQATCVYDFMRVKLSDNPESLGYGKSLNVATLEVLVAEKIVAMAHAIERNRRNHREVDVFDLASLLSAEAQLDIPRLRELVRRRVAQHGIDFPPNIFDATGREYIRHNYESLRETTGPHFIPFEPAWDRVLKFIEHVRW